MNRRLYSDAERDLVHEWAGKWLELIKLINEVAGTDGPPWSSPPPAEMDEIRYMGLRFWFLSRQLWSRRKSDLSNNLLECASRALLAIKDKYVSGNTSTKISCGHLSVMSVYDTYK